MKKTILIVVLILSFKASAQKKERTLNVFTFAEVEKMHHQKPKPIVIFIYTDWCKICHAMEKTTLQNKEVVQLLNDKFYFIKLNGEETKNITFLGKTFIFKPTGVNTGVHELATQLASVKNKITYPTTTILDTNFKIDAQLLGFYNSKTIVSLSVR